MIAGPARGGEQFVQRLLEGTAVGQGGERVVQGLVGEARGRLLDARLQRLVRVGDRARHRVEAVLERAQLLAAGAAADLHVELAARHAAHGLDQPGHRRADHVGQADGEQHREQHRAGGQADRGQHHGAPARIVGAGVELHIHPADGQRRERHLATGKLVDLDRHRKHRRGKARACPLALQAHRGDGPPCPRSVVEHGLAEADELVAAAVVQHRGGDVLLRLQRQHQAVEAAAAARDHAVLGGGRHEADDGHTALGDLAVREARTARQRHAGHRHRQQQHRQQHGEQQARAQGEVVDAHGRPPPALRRSSSPSSATLMPSARAT